MVRPDVSDIGQASVSVQSADGSASFERIGTDQASLAIRYDTPGLRVGLEQDNLAAGIQALAVREVERMRAVLRNLGEELAGNLREEGKTPIISRTWRNQEERTWRDSGRGVAVDPSQTRMAETLRGYVGASDAKLVRETVRLMIGQREENIRDIYQRILQDAQAKRREGEKGHAEDSHQDNEAGSDPNRLDAFRG